MDYKVEAGILNLAIRAGSRELWANPLCINNRHLTPDRLGYHISKSGMSAEPNCPKTTKINVKQMFIKRSSTNLIGGSARNLASGRGSTTPQALQSPAQCHPPLGRREDELRARGHHRPNAPGTWAPATEQGLLLPDLALGPQTHCRHRIEAATYATQQAPPTPLATNVGHRGSRCALPPSHHLALEQEDPLERVSTTQGLRQYSAAASTVS